MKIKRLVDNKMRDYGQEDDRTRTIKVNKALSKRDPNLIRPVNKGASRYPGVLDTIVHEEMHAHHPKMTEKQVWKRTRHKMTSMKPQAKQKAYAKYK